MILMLDNYDSFTYNIVHYLREIGCEVMVKRNNEIDIEGIKNLNPSHIVISPGPGNPNGSGISLTVVTQLTSYPILGVCLGHQCIGQSFGGKIVRSKNICHGKGSKISHNQQGVFKGISTPFTAIRYHSLVIEKTNFPDSELEIMAYSEDKEIMAIQHRIFPLVGIQFHPESIGSEFGHNLLRNFINHYSGHH